MAHDVHEKPAAAATVPDSDDLSTLTAWMLAVCLRSNKRFDQVFIYRRPSIFKRLTSGGRIGEIKAIGMPDLTEVAVSEFRALLESRKIVRLAGKWPGIWVKPGPSLIPASERSRTSES